MLGYAFSAESDTSRLVPCVPDLAAIRQPGRLNKQLKAKRTVPHEAENQGFEREQDPLGSETGHGQEEEADGRFQVFSGTGATASLNCTRIIVSSRPGCNSKMIMKLGACPQTASGRALGAAKGAGGQAPLLRESL